MDTPSAPILEEIENVVSRPEVLRRLRMTTVASADSIVSADVDLLSLSEIQGIPIVDVPTFWQKLTEERD